MADKPDKTDEHTTPAGESPVADNPVPESPVYDSLVDTGEPVVATVEPEATRTPPPLVEPEEIVVEPSNSSDYLDEPAAVVPERVNATPESDNESAGTREYERSEAEPVREPVHTPVHETRVIDEPAASAPYPSQPQVVYVNAPQAPTAKGNRGFGVLISIAATIVFQVVLTIVMAIVYSSLSGGASFGFITQAAFYVPALFFFIGMVALVLILNRAGWWTYVIGSVFVALPVYFGTIGTLLLGSNIILQTPDVAAALFREGLSNPFTIAAALVAREVAIWTGAIIASRGRKVKARNAEAKAAFDSEQAQKRAY